MPCRHTCYGAVAITPRLRQHIRCHIIIDVATLSSCFRCCLFSLRHRHRRHYFSLIFSPLAAFAITRLLMLHLLLTLSLILRLIIAFSAIFAAADVIFITLRCCRLLSVFSHCHCRYCCFLSISRRCRAICRRYIGLALPLLPLIIYTPFSLLRHCFLIIAAIDAFDFRLRCHYD